MRKNNPTLKVILMTAKKVRRKLINMGLYPTSIYRKPGPNSIKFK